MTQSISAELARATEQVNAVERLIHAGGALSNIAYNLKQRDDLPDPIRASLARCEKEWGEALAAYRAAPESLGVPASPSGSSLKPFGHAAIPNAGALLTDELIDKLWNMAQGNFSTLQCRSRAFARALEREIRYGACPSCDGSGEITVLSGGGPDAYDVPANCDHCGGSGGLDDAYEGVVKHLAAARAENMQLLGVVYFGKEAEVAERDRRDAVRYRTVRRGQHWSVVNGIGETLRAETLDAAVDATYTRGHPAPGIEACPQGLSGKPGPKEAPKDDDAELGATKGDA